MNVVKRNAWNAFKNVIETFCLEITKMKTRIMLENFHILGYNEFESAFPIFALKSFS
jgi:hypothetical protein